MKTERLSTLALYIMVGLAVLLFALFYLVGYDMPFVLEPEYNAPLFTDVLLAFIYLMVLAAVSVAACSVVRGYRRRSSESVVNGIPVARIAWGTVAFLVLLLVVTFLLGSAKPLGVNGKTFSDAFWLKATDMFINTSLTLLVVATVAVGLSLSGISRKRK